MFTVFREYKTHWFSKKIILFKSEANKKRTKELFSVIIYCCKRNAKRVMEADFCFVVNLTEAFNAK